MEYIEKYKFAQIKERIAECILDANSRYESRKSDTKIFRVKINGKIINIEQDRILFFETSSEKHKIVLHAIGRKIEFSGNLNDIEKKLDNNFYRCHKSYIINKENIKEIDIKNKIVHMVNGGECMVSYRKFKGLINNK